MKPVSLEKFCLKDQVAYVCGGAGLIGREISRSFASAGAKTVILDINRHKGKRLARLFGREGGTISYEYFDITDLKRFDENLGRLVRKYQGIHIWVNAAYPRTADWGSKLGTTRLKSFRKNIDCHLNAYAWSSWWVALRMKKRGVRGSIINLGSIYGVQANDFSVYKGTRVTSPMVYSTIKGGILNTTRYLASYFGRFGIRVNNLCPGGIFDNQNKRFVRNYEEKVPLKRMGRPEEIASVALFLASEASSYVTGHTMMVDGGWTIV